MIHQAAKEVDNTIETQLIALLHRTGFRPFDFVRFKADLKLLGNGVLGSETGFGRMVEDAERAWPVREG
jgi:hypothetical protein